MEKKKSGPKLSPDAAKILEQYRNAGKTPADRVEGGPAPDSVAPAAPKASSPPPPSTMRRSGTRGK